MIVGYRADKDQNSAIEERARTLKYKNKSAYLKALVAKDLQTLTISEKLEPQPQKARAKVSEAQIMKVFK